MEGEENLMAFNSPPRIMLSLLEPASSPGSNPFDTMLKIASDSSERPTLSETNILNVAFTEGTTFSFTQTLSSENTTESLGVPNLNEDFCGRESLGILHIDFEKLDEDISTKDTLPFPLPGKSSYRSFLKSISSRDSQSSFPSTIYSVYSNPTPTGLFNIALSPSLIEKHLASANALILSPRRLKSASSVKHAHHEESRKRALSANLDLERNRPGGGLFSVTAPVSPKTADDSLVSINSSEGIFEVRVIILQEDLVFLEANQMASKIADGSIYEEGG